MDEGEGVDGETNERESKQDAIASAVRAIEDGWMDEPSGWRWGEGRKSVELQGARCEVISESCWTREWKKASRYGRGWWEEDEEDEEGG